MEFVFQILKLEVPAELAAQVFKAIVKLSTEQRDSFLEQAHILEGEKSAIIAVLLGEGFNLRESNWILISNVLFRISRIESF